MVSLIVILVLLGLVAWGIYFYYKAGQLNKLIAEQQISSSKMDNVN